MATRLPAQPSGPYRAHTAPSSRRFAATLLGYARHRWSGPACRPRLTPRSWLLRSQFTQRHRPLTARKWSSLISVRGASIGA